MSNGNLKRAISEPIREGLSWEKRWKGVDQGLIYCWERGRQLAVESPELANAAKAGEPPILAWRGGVEQKLKDSTVKTGTLQYLAMWQGLRNTDMAIELDRETLLTCARTGQVVQFS